MHPIYAPSLTINQSGNYRLGDNVTYSPGSADSIISITSSDVNLDLGGYYIAQGNTTANFNGINIAAGLSNITIKNGKIRDVTNTGLTIQTTCSAIETRDIAFENCQTRGFSATSLTLSKIEDCIFNGCCSGASGDNVLNLSSSNDIQVEKCTFSQNNNTNNTLTMINLSSCSRSLVENSLIANNSANLFTAINISSCSYMVVEKCNILNNTATGSGTISVIFMQNSSNNQLKNCYISGCTSGTASINVFDTSSGANNVFIECIADANRLSGTNAGTLNGFNIQTSSNSCFRCQSINHLSGGSGTVNGFNLDGATRAQIIECIGSNNVSGGTAQGLVLQNSADLCVVDQSEFNYNIGSSASTSHGINNASTGTNNTFTRNVALFNGSTSASLAQQLLNIAATNQQAILNTGSVNSLTVPWTNIAIAPNA